MNSEVRTVSFLSRLVLLLVVGCGGDLSREGLVVDGTFAETSDESLVGISDETLAGTLRLRILDHADGSKKQYLLTTGEGERVILLFDADPQLQSGENVEVSGVRLAKGPFAVGSLRRLTRRARRVDAPLTRVSMHHRVAVLAMQEASASEQQALEAMNGAAYSVEHFYAETTYGMDTFSGDIFRRYDISYTQNDCLWDNCYAISDAMIEAFENDGHNTSDYDHVVIIVPTKCGSDWSGAWADVGAITDNGEIRNELLTMYKDDAVDSEYFAHELGHNLGMNHSRSVDCGSAIYTPKAQGCAFEEYGNHNDVMGWGGGVYFSTAYQRYLGWLGGSNVVTAGRSDTFNLQPADGEMCGIRAVRILIPGEGGSYFYLEYRRARADSLYAGTGDSGGSRQNALLLLRSRDGGGGDASSNVDRVELGTSRYNGAEQGVRYDLGEGVAVKVLSMDGPVAQVAIELPGSVDHRDDDDSAVFVAPDGSIGTLSCGDANDDACPDDPNKTSQGLCGCGVSDVDTDGDGAADCNDACSDDPDKTEPGVCGCGTPDRDSNGDGVADSLDACPDEGGQSQAGRTEETPGDDDGGAEPGSLVVGTTSCQALAAPSTHIWAPLLGWFFLACRRRRRFDPKRSD